MPSAAIGYRISGNTGGRAQSIASGIVAGSILGYTLAINLRREGHPIPCHIADLNIPFQDTAHYTRKRFLAQLPDTVENLLRALIESIDYLQNFGNKNSVLKSLAHWFRPTKTEDALEGYESMRNMDAKRIYPNPRRHSQRDLRARPMPRKISRPQSRGSGR